MNRKSLKEITSHAAEGWLRATLNSQSPTFYSDEISITHFLLLQFLLQFLSGRWNPLHRRTSLSGDHCGGPISSSASGYRSYRWLRDKRGLKSEAKCIKISFRNWRRGVALIFLLIRRLGKGLIMLRGSKPPLTLTARSSKALTIALLSGWLNTPRPRLLSIPSRIAVHLTRLPLGSWCVFLHSLCRLVSAVVAVATIVFHDVFDFVLVVLLGLLF